MSSSPSQATYDWKAIASDAEAINEWIVERRHHMHRHPELSFEEVETSAFLRREIEALGLTVNYPVREGVEGFHVDIISDAQPDKFILLRADFDALPIQEENDISFKSTVDGKGHLCGHDCHSTMLLGAAKLLSERRDQLPISVRLVFQHAEEEAPGGAIDFVRAGLLKDVLGCFGIHVSPRVEKGRIGLRSGETMAAVGTFRANIVGQGCHAAMPHEGIDPTPAAAAAILNLQQISARRTAPSEPIVVSTTYLRGGTVFNQIPESVFFAGTFRTFNVARIEEIETSIRDIISSTASAYGCRAELEVFHTYPPLINDENAIAAAKETVLGLFGEDGPSSIPLNMGGEDFAYFALEKPSAFVQLGVAVEGQPKYSLHHCKFLPQDDILWRGSALLAALPWVAPKYL